MQKGVDETGSSKQSKDVLELAQTKSISSAKSEDNKLEAVADEMMEMKKGLKSIFETKFVIEGVVWSVWDWTIFVILVAIILVAALLFFLICWCCYPNRYDEEKDAVDDQNNKSLNRSREEQAEAKARLSASLAAAGTATMDVAQRDIYKNAPEKKMEGGEDMAMGDAEIRAG